jgi:hypothetical protein
MGILDDRKRGFEEKFRREASVFERRVGKSFADRDDVQHP